jgi:hypothetical protein
MLHTHELVIYLCAYGYVCMFTEASQDADEDDFVSAPLKLMQVALVFLEASR